MLRYKTHILLLMTAILLAAPPALARQAATRDKERRSLVQSARYQGKRLTRTVRVRGRRLYRKVCNKGKCIVQKIRQNPKVAKVLKKTAKVKRAMGKRLRILGGYTTLAADKLERRLPRRAGKAFHKLRLLAPGHLSGFAATKFKQDPLFLSGFGVAFPIAAHLQIPAFIALGMNPGVALVAHEVTEIPMSLGILTWRQHKLRKDRSQTFGQTLKGLGKEYSAFADKDMERSRRMMHRYLKAKKARAEQPAQAHPVRTKNLTRLVDALAP